ncbi:MAG TPA: Crp/Fnr family transcriptional regulator [Bryobacteraceae bacterium]|nr:Crp/Fnr family transcriptional regulator [Bryobacteraceae bacterium]
MDKAAALKRTALFSRLHPEQLAALAALAHSRHLAPGEVLFLAGEKASGLFIIVSGRIRAYRVNTRGREQTIHTEGPGATLAEVPMFDEGPYPATAVAEEQTLVLFLEKADICNFMLRNPAVALTALKLMAQRLRAHVDLVDTLALQQVGQRLARILLEQCRDHGLRTRAGLEVDLAFSNEELATRIGSVREVVSRAMARMERDGLIARVRGAQRGKRRRLRITDELSLARYAGEGRARRIERPGG